MARTIIFLCPHSAAKSVAAAAFLTREAVERGLTLQISVAGTHPDPDILPIVRTRLEMEGLPVHEPPRKVTDEDLTAADMIVNMGCDHDDLPTLKALTEWHIPDFSVDPEAAFTALENRVTDLATQLAAQ